VLFYTLKQWNQQKIILLTASYIFYAAWNPPFVFLLIFASLFDWLIAKKIYTTEEKNKKKIWLIASLISNLGLLSYFKYGNFLLDNFIVLINFIGLNYQAKPLDIILPMGISFYTFQTLSYTIDVYKNQIKSADSFLDFAFFVTFFPQLVAGPIVRACDFLPQCSSPKKASADQFGWGLTLMLFGIFSKVYLSDQIFAPLADAGYNNINNLQMIEAWLTVLAFSGQIFFDFSGYSTAAVGIALLFGFVLPDNFRAPYMALGFADFWHRWHISLSTWLKDYLYIPLGGNRISPARTYINLLMTMLIGGLWHGASWLFVIWGGLHGIYLIIENSLKSKNFPIYRLINNKLIQIFLALLTFIIVSVTWVFFRAQNLDDALSLLKILFVENKTNENKLLQNFPIEIIPHLFIVLTGLLIWHWHIKHSSLEYIFQKFSPMTRSISISVPLLILIFTTGGDERAFIYFQF
jgi:alginate O-acetyltransferase complex protein AlgI